MNYKVVYTKKSLGQLKKLDRKVAGNIVRKVSFYARNNSKNYAKKLKHPAFGEYRFRVGDWRVIFDLDKSGKINILFILAIKHRKGVYKDL